MELLIVRSLFACNVTDVPALVNAVMVEGAMMLSVPEFVANVKGFGTIAAEPELSMTMFSGSSNSMPAAPCAALASTLPVKSRFALPDTST